MRITTLHIASLFVLPATLALGDTFGTGVNTLDIEFVTIGDPENIPDVRRDDSLTFIGGYVESLLGFNGWMVYLAFYTAFVGIHLWGAGEALRTMMVITLLAVLAIVVFVVAMIPHFSVDNLFNIPINDSVVGASRFLPQGYMGIWAAIPFAMWLFLAVEGVPLAALYRWKDIQF